jgi:hypothetical protein
MSGRRSRQQRTLVAVVEEHYDTAASPGLCVNTPEAIAEMKQLTHDGIIAEAGHRRRSGVRWGIWYGAEATSMYEEMISETDTQPDPRTVEVYRAYLAEHGPNAVLVVAMIDVVPPSGRVLLGPG